ncbi:MAG: response regulator transcription factor [Nannocystaceae bacterium]
MPPSATSAIRVVLAEDHTIVREGLRALLDSQPRMFVVAEATDGEAAVQACRQHLPDVVIMDLGMPKLNGVDATREIAMRCPRTKVLVLSMHGGEEYVRPAVRAGASGYLVKGSGISDLISAIESVHRGNAFFSPSVAHGMLANPTTGAAPTPRTEPRLTPRETEVLILVAEGRSSPEIARNLDLSVKTIEGHRGHIMTKLDARNVAGLVRHAIRLRLVSAD